MKNSSSGGGGVLGQQAHEGDKKCLNSELWHACAGPLVSLPTMGSRVVYFPQGHSEQVAATTNKEIDGHIPDYPSLPPQMICQLHNVTMHADLDTDEVYAQMTLQPLSPQEQKDTFLPVELGIVNKQPSNYFCKTLTASDTSTHGGFSVPRRAAEKVFPPLDFSQQPPAQELTARDLHDVEWKFRHIFRGQPKRHLLTTGWSVFVSAKRLVAGDSVLFIWNEKNQLFLGIRHAVRPQTVVPSSVLSSDSMHIGLLAAAAHAAATNSCFTVFYNPRTSPSEFVIPLSKFVKAVVHTRVSVGMRFRMLFETEESSVRRYMGTITGISDLDSVRWPNSHWRSVKVGWDESTAGERQPRVSLWEIEPLTTFPMYPSMFPLRLKRPWHPGVSTLLDNRDEASNASMWLRGDTGEERMHSLSFQPVGMLPWMQQRLEPTMYANAQNQQYQAMLVAGMQNDPLKQQFMQLQQSPLLQQQQYQVMHQQMPQQILHSQQTQNLPENMVQHLLHQQLQNQQPRQLHQTYQDGFQIESDQLQLRQQLDVASPSYPKSDFTNSSGIQNLLSPTCTNGSGSLLDLSKNGQSMLNDLPSHQPWGLRFAHPDTHDLPNSLSLPHSSQKDAAVEPENYGLVAQNHTIFGVNIDSTGLLLPTTIPSYATSSNDTDVTLAPLGTSMFQSSLYNCMNDSSELLHSAVNIGSPNPAPTFVKVYKSGSVGRSLDISRFSSYHQLREELGQMFRVEGNLDDPLRSGWQLVFVDRENDALLLGDDPWEVFVNNVGYINVLSQEDVQNMGKQGVEPSFDNDARDFVSKLPAVGSHEFGDDRKQWTVRG